MKIGEKTEKCYFLKILQWPDFEILGGHSDHQDTPKNQRARHGTFFFVWTTFSSHVRRLPPPPRRLISPRPRPWWKQGPAGGAGGRGGAARG